MNCKLRSIYKKKYLLYLQVEYYFLDSNKLREIYRLDLIDDYKAFQP